jgi:hypothetical protein
VYVCVARISRVEVIAAAVVDTVNVSPAIIAVTPTGFAPIAYEIEVAAGSAIKVGDGYGVGVAVVELLGRGVGEIDGVGDADGTA